MRFDLVANFLIFQLGWFVSVLGAAYGWPWAGALYAVTWLAVHSLALGSGRGEALRLALAAAALGYVIDSALVLGGAIAFPEQTRLGWPSPLWMMVLWLMFSMTLRHSLGWLRGRYLLAATLGAVGGPLAYWAGEQLGAIQLTGAIGAAAVAVAWILGMVALLRIEVLSRSKTALPDHAPSKRVDRRNNAETAIH